MVRPSRFVFAKTVIIILFFFDPVQLSGQIKNIEIETNLLFSYNRYDVISTNHVLDYSYDWYLGGLTSADIKCSYDFNSSWQISGGIGYTEYWIGYHNPNPSLVSGLYINLLDAYWGVPIHLSYNVSKQKFRFRPFIGTGIGYSFTAEPGVVYRDTYSNSGELEVHSALMSDSKWVWDVRFGLKVDYLITNSIGINVGVQITRGFIKIATLYHDIDNVVSGESYKARSEHFGSYDSISFGVFYIIEL